MSYNTITVQTEQKSIFVWLKFSLERADRTDVWDINETEEEKCSVRQMLDSEAVSQVMRSGRLNWFGNTKHKDTAGWFMHCTLTNW